MGRGVYAVLLGFLNGTFHHPSTIHLKSPRLLGQGIPELVTELWTERNQPRSGRFCQAVAPEEKSCLF